MSTGCMTPKQAHKRKRKLESKYMSHTVFLTEENCTTKLTLIYLWVLVRWGYESAYKVKDVL